MHGTIVLTPRGFYRRCGPDLRVHPRHPGPPVPRAAVLRLRERQPARVLGAVRLLEPDLDPRRAHQLVRDRRAQLRLRRRRLRRVGRVPAAEPVPRHQRHGPAEEQGAVDCRAGAARRLGYRYQGAVLCAREPGGKEARGWWRGGEAFDDDDVLMDGRGRWNVAFGMFWLGPDTEEKPLAWIEMLPQTRTGLWKALLDISMYQ